jgi:hypothetical protein
MTSERQKAANRTNARHSTGPKTPEGKAAVRLNACWHTTDDLRHVLAPTLFAFSLSDAVGLVAIGGSNPSASADDGFPLIALVPPGRAGGSEDIIRRTQRAQIPVDVGRGLLLWGN